MIRLNITNVTVSLNREEALSVINHLNKGLDNKHVFQGVTPEIQGAVDLLALLNGCFNDSYPGIHRPERRIK